MCAGRESSADSFLSDIPFKQCPSPSCSKLCFSETHLGKSINCFFVFCFFVFFLLVQIYRLCKHGLTFLLDLSNLFSNFQKFSKVSCLYMVFCTIFSAHRNFIYLIWIFSPLCSCISISL